MSTILSKPPPTQASPAQPEPQVIAVRRHRSRTRKGFYAVCGLAGSYLLLAYAVLPAYWSHRFQHPALEDAPRISRTKDGRPGDPLNIALIGTEEEVIKALVAAGWHPADKITFKSCRRMVSATVLRRPYEDAPVSSLYINKKMQDLAFQQMVGKSPAKRHHVRFWKREEENGDGRRLWLGSATYDMGVKVNKYNVQPTHRVAPDVDEERDKLLADLKATQQLDRVSWFRQFHAVTKGVNGGGDPWRTDGNLAVVVIAPGGVSLSAPW
jgi:hypothetical protein